MKKGTEVAVVIGAVIGIIALAVGISALLAWGLSWGLAFAFGLQIGFLKTWVAMFVIQIISNVAFSGLRNVSKKEEK
ncbi:hypothetical protein [Peribacillus frigoritolerans]|uniref:hypothetical protein n=1 Tax=Peribacillus frigoritolerans TaxID=450367 RepID=UPI002E1A21BC|nr:hypothetical protein [Peribacillus frigoritolerans]MED3845568.1 hypothetical protein [Peribacillus frigoritolerans]